MRAVLAPLGLNLLITLVIGTPTSALLAWALPISVGVAFLVGYGTAFGLLMLAWVASLMSWRAMAQLVPVGIGTAVIGTPLSRFTAFPIGYLITAGALLTVWFVGLVRTTAKADADKLIAEAIARDLGNIG